MNDVFRTLYDSLPFQQALLADLLLYLLKEN